MTTAEREADKALEGVIDAALELESRRCFGKPATEKLQALEVVQQKINRARKALTQTIGKCPTPFGARDE